MIYVFIAYLLVLLIIVGFSAKRSTSNTDFVLGGGKVGSYSLALSERATGESAWLLLGLTGHAYAEGWSTIWVAVGCVLGVGLIWMIMAQPLQRFAAVHGALTVPSLFMKRFVGKEKAIGAVSSLVIIFFFVLYIASQFAGAGKIFLNTFGLDPLWGMVIGAGLVTLYTMLGGFITVVATDAFQAILMVITCVVLPIVAVVVLMISGLDVTNLGINETSISTSGVFSSLLVINGLSWALGYTGQPQLLTRLMAMRNPAEVTKGRRVAITWTLLAYSGAFVTGVLGFQLAQHGLLGDSATLLANDAEQIMPVMVMVLLPPFVAGILLSGAVSAMMSTASSQLMIASTAIGEDLSSAFNLKSVSDKKQLRLNRWLIVIVGIVAFGLGVSVEDTVYGMVSYAWSGIGASFGPAVLLLLFWKRFSFAGLMGSLIGGTMSAVVWKTFMAESTGVSERIVSFAIATFLAVLFSLLFPISKKLLKPFT